MLALPDPRRPDRANPPQNFWLSLLFVFWQHFYDLHALGSHWTKSQQGILCWGFKGVQEEIPSEEGSLFKSDQWNFHQDNAPVYNSSLVTDYLTKLGIKTVAHPPYRRDFAPCDFWLFLKLRGYRYETIEEMKEASTRVIDMLTQWGLPEFVETVEEVHCNRSRLLQRELEFHVCTINKSAQTKKVWKLI